MARALVGYARLDVDPRRIRLAGPGMKITLNGIAQGYVTDRISSIYAVPASSTR